jgi:hypothetical protein
MRDFYNTPMTLKGQMEYSVETDTSYKFNNIQGGAFQFTYRFYIPEMGYSTSAPFTAVASGFSYERYDGSSGPNSTSDNSIQLTVVPPIIEGISTDRKDLLFEHCEILMRSAEISEWQSVYIIQHDEFAQDASNEGDYTFYNSLGLNIADSAAIEVPFNALPRTSNSQTSLDGERVAYGGVKEGFDVTNINVDLTASFVEYGEDAFSVGALQETISFTKTDTWFDGGIYHTYKTANITTTPSAGDTLIAEVHGRLYYQVLTSSQVSSTTSYANAIAELLSRSLYDFQRVSGPAVQSPDLPNELNFTLKRYLTTATPVRRGRKFTSLKTGAWHSYCMFYADELIRRSEATPIDPIYIPFVTETGESAGTGQRRYIDYTINHTPPSWAKWWRFGYSGNTSIDRFWQYNIAEAGVASSGVEDGLSYVSLQNLQGIKTDSSLTHNFPNSTIDTYSFVEGDRVRFLTSKNDSAASTLTLTVDDWSTRQNDYEIVSFDSSTNYIYFQSDGFIGDGTGGSTDYNSTSVVVEVYRPNKESQSIVYSEIGNWTPITSGSHNNSSGSIYQGDCYLITRTMTVPPPGFTSDTDPVFVESYSMSDFRESEIWGKGKFGASFNIGEQDLNNIRYSNQLVKNSLASGVAVFDGLDYKTMSYEYGDIQAMRQIGDMLKVWYDNNVASVLVNKTLFFNSDGTSQVVKSDGVLGSANYSEDDWGTVNPESIVVVDRTAYFYDQNRKTYVRNSVNGSFPIGDYKMSKYFEDQTNALITSGITDVKVFGGWDDHHKLLYVGFRDPNTAANNEYVLFHEPSNRWVTFVSSGSSTPMLTTTPFKMFSPVSEDMYIHLDSATRCNFFDAQYTYTARIYGGLTAPGIIKMFDCIALHTNKYFDVTDIQIPASLNYSDGMQSKIPELRFKKVEGVLRSDYLCNMKTTSSVASTLDLVNGDNLRGYTIYNDLDGDETVEHNLYKVDIFQTISKY